MNLLPLALLLLAVASAGVPLMARPRLQAAGWPWLAVASLAASALVWSLLQGAYAAGGAAAAVLLLVVTVPVGAVAAQAMLGDWRMSERHELLQDEAAVGTPRRGRSGLVVATAAAALAGLAVATGLGGVGAALLLGTIAWLLLDRVPMPGAALAIVAAIAAAAYVVLARLLLSPLSLIGNKWATWGLLAVAAVAVGLRNRPMTGKEVLSRTTTLDVVAIAAGAATTGGWLLTFHGQGDLQDLATLTRLGEDNVSHILMLEATSSGSVLGGSAQSLEVSTHFAGYFPGAASLGAGLRGMLPTGTTATSAYVALTAILLGLLVMSALSAARLVTRSGGAVAAVLLATLGAVAAWVTYGQYTRGFPGQLAVASWLVAAVLLLLRRERSRPRPNSPRGLPSLLTWLAVLSLAAWWTWNLAVPLLLLAAAVLLWPTLSERVGGHRAGVAAGIVAVLTALGAVSVGRGALVTVLDELSTPGGVDASIPFWLAFSLAALFGVVLAVSGLRTTPAVAVLVGGAVLLTAVLVAWQTARTGGPTYYSYKVEYLVLAMAWAGLAIGCVPVARGLAGSAPVPPRPLVVLVATATAGALVTAPALTFANSMRSNGLVPASGPLVCALDVASQHPGAAMVAYGFGSPTEDYLATRAMTVATGNDRTAPLWTPVITGVSPAQLDWSAVVGPRALVVGPSPPSPPVSLPSGEGIEVDRTSCSAAP